MKKGFNRNRLIVMSLGNIIGSGIFLGSSTVILVAGPAAVISYLFGGLLMTFEVMFITEMCVINPAPGAFRVHSSEVFGPWIGFVNGWMFWCSGVLGMASEVVAAAIFTGFWFPNIPLWVFCILLNIDILTRKPHCRYRKRHICSSYADTARMTTASRHLMLQQWCISARD